MNQSICVKGTKVSMDDWKNPRVGPLFQTPHRHKPTSQGSQYLAIRPSICMSQGCTNREHFSLSAAFKEAMREREREREGYFDEWADTRYCFGETAFL
uniref:Uncharacterized protein n=1 Tax=Theropithecus gelada TaxID=9565 RepID=A0A8D2JU40_THEGE